MKFFQKHYRAVMITASFFQLIFVHPAIADATHSHEKSIEEVVVTASPFAKSTEMVNHPVNLLSGDKLQNAAAATLGETLNGQLGVSSASFGPGVGLPIIRGQSDNRVKVMQDSVGSMDASSASPDHAISLEPLLASKIEVLRGPAALRYGSGAIGGVVNVLDNRIPSQVPEGITGGAELRHSSVNNETVGVANLNTALGNVAFHLDGIKRENDDINIPGFSQQEPDDAASITNGYIANTDAKSTSGTAGVSYSSDNGFIGISLNELENNYGVPPDSEEQVRIDMHQTRYDVKGELTNPFAHFAKITTRFGHNDYQHTEIEENGEAGTQFTNDAYEGRVELMHNPLSFFAAVWQGAIGVQLAQSTFAAIGDEAFIPKSDISSRGFFVLEETTQGAWTYELGARVDTQTIDPELGATLHHNSVNLSGSSTWHFTESQQIIIGLAQSQRAPSVEELLAFGPHPASGSYLKGNETLHEETSNNIELAYHWHKDNIQASVNLFYNQINDFIYTQNLNETIEELKVYQYAQANATFKGWETEIKIPFHKKWSVRLFSDSVRATLEGDEDLPRITPLRFGSSLDYDAHQWSGNLSLSHTAKQNHAGPYETASESYTRVDARLGYTIKNGATDYTLFLKASNLANEEIRNASSYLRAIAPEAGRNLQAGVRVKF